MGMLYPLNPFFGFSDLSLSAKLFRSDRNAVPALYFTIVISRSIVVFMYSAPVITKPSGPLFHFAIGRVS